MMPQLLQDMHYIGPFAAMFLFFIVLGCTKTFASDAPEETVDGARPRRSITVGHANADIVGTTGQAIQAAIDTVALSGGGVVHVKAGEYLLQDSVRLRPHVHLIGEPGKTVLKRGPLVWSDLAVDADRGQRVVTPTHIDGFQPGMGVVVWDRERGWLYPNPSRAYTVTAVEDGNLYLHDLLPDDRLAEDGGRVINHFALVMAERADHAVIDGLIVDAAVDDPDDVLAGLRCAVVYVWRSRHVTVRNVTAIHGQGDGIAASTASEHAIIENCEAAHNKVYGIHPGSHSRCVTVRNCKIHHNDRDGLYICWGISQSEFTDNEIHHNGLAAFRSGISIGHKDTDNLIARNHIYENARNGITFRRKTLANGAHRNRIEGNTIENNGSPADAFGHLQGRISDHEFVFAGIDISGHTNDILIRDNVIRETRKGSQRLQRHAVRLHPDVQRVTMTGNTLEGHPDQAIVDESGNDGHQLQDVPASE